MYLYMSDINELHRLQYSLHLETRLILVNEILDTLLWLSEQNATEFDVP